jgi:hypothetical protein
LIYSRLVTTGRRAEFSCAEWTIAIGSDRAIGLLGATWEPDAPADECHLEYLWVSPEVRHSGIALAHMVEEAARQCGHLDLLRERIDGQTGM